MRVFEALSKLQLQLCLKRSQGGQGTTREYDAAGLEVLDLAEPDAGVEAPEPEDPSLRHAVAHVAPLVALFASELDLALVRRLILLIVEVDVEIVHIGIGRGCRLYNLLGAFLRGFHLGIDAYHTFEDLVPAFQGGFLVELV